MGFRNFDWECRRCKAVHEELVFVSSGKLPPRRKKLHCWMCAQEGEHERLLSMPAKYMGEKSHSPIVHGGKFDTAGKELPPPLPDVPDGLSADGVLDVFQSKEYREVKRQRAEVAERNAAKRKRLAAHKRTNGGVDFRRNRLKGDPKITG